REAIRSFQKTSGLKPTGVVDAQTMSALAAGVPRAPVSRAPAVRRGALVRAVAPSATAEPIPADEQLVVRGHVVYKEGLLIEGITVRAFNLDLRHEDFLGEAVTDREGRFDIAYSAKQFSRPDKKYADLVVRAFDLRENAPPDQRDTPVAESSIIFGAQPV